MLAAFTTPSKAVDTHAPGLHTSVQLAPGVDESSHEYHVELTGTVTDGVGEAEGVIDGDGEAEGRMLQPLNWNDATVPCAAE